MKVCTRCKQESNIETDKFCRDCGKELENSMTCCNNELGIKDRHCPTCGKKRPKFQSEIDREEARRKYEEERMKEDNKNTGCFALGIFILILLIMFLVNGVAAFFNVEYFHL